MTFTVSCPSCGMSFPVDAAKVPEGGVRAQCNMCPEIFDVDRPDATAAVAAPSIAVADPPASGAAGLPTLDAPVVTDEPVAEVTGETFGALEPTAEFVPPPTTPEPVAEAPTAAPVAPEAPLQPIVAEPAAPPPTPAEPAPTPAPTEPPAAPESSGPIRFGRRSPADKAKSLARSLASDLIAYNPEKHKDALAAGTLEEVFGEEIAKSLKEYQEQVEPDVMAQGTIFNDALNSILAEGQSVFSLNT